MQEKILKNDSGMAYDYLLYKPKDFKKDLPLVVFLHGSGECGNNLDLLKCHCMPSVADKDDFDKQAVIVSPQLSIGEYWVHDIYTLHDFIIKIADKYSIDKNKIALTGVSIGGFGTWEMALTFPDTFAAIAPMCGGGMYWRSSVLKNMKIRVFHGMSDDVIYPHYSIDMVDAINRNGGHAELTMYYGVGHDCWFKAYAESDIVDWLIAQSK